MATEILMPKLGLTMQEGQLVEWLAGEGDFVKKGQEIANIETDKVTNTIEAEADGILHQLASEGDTVDVGKPVGYISAEGEPIP